MNFDSEGFEVNPATGKRFKYGDADPRPESNRKFHAYVRRKSGLRKARFVTRLAFETNQANTRRRFAGPTRALSAVKNGMLRDARDRAAKKNVPFAITAAWLEGELRRALDSGEVVLNQTETSKNARSPSLDRLVPKLGYVPSNCRVVPLQLNVARGPWDDESFLDVLGPEVDRLRAAKRARVEFNS